MMMNIKYMYHMAHDIYAYDNDMITYLSNDNQPSRARVYHMHVLWRVHYHHNERSPLSSIPYMSCLRI